MGVLESTIGGCEKALAAEIRKAFGIGFTPKVEVAKEFGDLAFACFPLASTAKKNPKETAEALARKLNEKPPAFIEKTEAVNGFVNFFFNDSFYAQALGESLSPAYGSGAEGKGKKIIVEFSQPNVGKPFHVGHIRSTILGDAVARLFESQGWKAVRMNYIGDSGTQVAKLLLAMELFKEKLPEVKDEKTMLDYYVKIHEEIKAKPELEEKAKEYQEKIEEGDSETIKKVEFIRKKSYEAFQRNYDLLGVKFDEVKGESEFVKDAKKIAGEALKKKIAFVDKGGETVVKLEPELPNFILLRSNGTTLYSTRDLALADFKKNKFDFDESVVLTAAEQNLYFKQIIRTLRLLGREYAGHYKHVGFGLISLQEGKLSSREGRVVFLEDVLNQATAYAKEEIESVAGNESIEEKRKGMSAKEIAQASETVGIGSAKFAVLRITPEKNIVFDLKKIVSFQGDTGAYVQYTCVRAESILGKAKEGKTKIPSSVPASAEFKFNAEEKNVASLIARFPLVMKSSCHSMQPHQLCDFSLRLSAAFNEFYHKHPVLKAEGGEREKRLLLVKATAGVLEKSLAILGIKIPEKM